MNFDVFLLFFNAILTTVISSAIVIIVLRKKYLPVIKKLEKEKQGDYKSRKESDFNINA